MYSGIATAIFLSLYRILLCLRRSRDAMFVLCILFIVSLPFSLPWILIHLLFSIRVHNVGWGERTMRFNEYLYRQLTWCSNLFLILSLFLSITCGVGYGGLYESFTDQSQDHNIITVKVFVYVMCSLNVLFFLIFTVAYVSGNLAGCSPPRHCLIIWGVILGFPIIIVVGNVCAALICIVALLKVLDVIVLSLLRADDPLIGDFSFVRYETERYAKEWKHRRLRHLISLFEEKRRRILIENLWQDDVVNVVLDYVQQLEGTEEHRDTAVLMDANVVAKIHHIDMSVVTSYTQTYRSQRYDINGGDSECDPLLSFP